MVNQCGKGKEGTACRCTCLVSFLIFFMVQPTPLFRLFLSFQTNITILTTNQCEKCHVHPLSGAGIQTHDLWNVSLLP